MIFAGIAAVFAVSGARADFVDGFEGSVIDPFWSTSTQSGSIALSTAKAHGGVQSAKFSSIATDADKYERLFHTFASPTYGTASVWIYDTGAGVSSSNSIGLAISNDSLGFSAGLTTFDYGFQGGGPGRGDQYNYYDLPAVDESTATGIFRTQAWHQFKFIDTPDSLSMVVDGTTVYTRAGGTPFTTIWLTSGAPSWRPAYDQYYDDFAFSATSVPEPSSFVLVVAGALGLAGYARCRSRRSRRSNRMADGQG